MMEVTTTMIRHTTQDQRGFTLVELVLAIAAFGVVALAVTEMFLSIQTIQRKAGYLEAATRAAQQEVESLRNNNYNQLTDGQTLTFTVPEFLPAPKSGSVAISEPLAGIKRVDVTVSYTDHGQAENVELSSTIGVIGISQ